MKNKHQDAIRDKVAREMAEAKRGDAPWIPLQELCRKYSVNELETALELLSLPSDKFAIEIATQALKERRDETLPDHYWIIRGTFYLLLLAILIALGALGAWLFTR
ncbi:MAG: hypothetical protein LV481_12775 [Methylacidiphilales bacterium]|nr:hypothetical protein [Candidatus Methylacidiphilales bacterium]